MSNKLHIFLDKLRVAKQVLLSKPAIKDETRLFVCPVCGAFRIHMHPVPGYYLGQWQKYQTIHNPFFMETMNLEHYMCSRCFSFDRDRIYALYLTKYFTENTGNIQLLDIAPNKALKAFIERYPNVSHRSMDLMMDDVDDNFDITDMNGYRNEQFDFFICSHVLEHIPDDRKAMQELYRILKKGGRGIAMVPINLQLQETMEDINCTDTAKRWKFFFQDDHVRIYSKADFVNRLESAGFIVEQLGKGFFGENIFKQYAIFPTSVLYVVSKN